MGDRAGQRLLTQQNSTAAELVPVVYAHRLNNLSTYSSAICLVFENQILDTCDGLVPMKQAEHDVERCETNPAIMTTTDTGVWIGATTPPPCKHVMLPGRVGELARELMYTGAQADCIVGLCAEMAGVKSRAADTNKQGDFEMGHMGCTVLPFARRCCLVGSSVVAYQPLASRKRAGGGDGEKGKQTMRICSAA